MKRNKSDKPRKLSIRAAKQRRGVATKTGVRAGKVGGGNIKAE